MKNSNVFVGVNTEVDKFLLDNYHNTDEFLITQCINDEYICIYSVGRNESEERFGMCFISDDFDDLVKVSFLMTINISLREWIGLPFLDRLKDLMGYYSHSEIFGYRRLNYSLADIKQFIENK